MLLDSTALLYRKHVSPDAQDGKWQFAYPEAVPGGDEELDADDVILYPSGSVPTDALTVTASCQDGGGGGDSRAEDCSDGTPVQVSSSEVRSAAELAVVTYGNGVPHALQAVAQTGHVCDVIDSPLLSRCPAALPALLLSRGYQGLLFIDVCRAGGGPLSYLATTLHAESALPPKWRLLAASPSYNPLGRRVTFMSAAKIGTALNALARDVGRFRIASGNDFSQQHSGGDALLSYVVEQ